MWKGKVLLVLMFGVPVLCHADGLLTPTEFPKTFQDLSFTDRVAVKEEGYATFADLSPYDKLLIVEADQGIDAEITAGEQNNQPSPTNLNTNNNPNTGVTPTQPIASNPAPVAPVAPTPPITPTPIYGTNSSYCQQMCPNIPQNQQYPIGKPVLESDYKFCSAYGVRNFGTKEKPKYDNHYGFDIGCTEAHFDRPVFATADGIVEKAKPNCRGSSAGNYIVIDHKNGFKTYYMHLNTMLVTKGQRVAAGCQIGTIGYTGGAKINKSQYANNDYPTMRKSISHLHYEIRYTGNLRSVPAADGRQIRVVHGFSGHSSVNPAYLMGVKK